MFSAVDCPCQWTLLSGLPYCARRFATRSLDLVMTGLLLPRRLGDVLAREVERGVDHLAEHRPGACAQGLATLCSAARGFDRHAPAVIVARGHEHHREAVGLIASVEVVH